VFDGISFCIIIIFRRNSSFIMAPTAVLRGEIREALVDAGLAKVDNDTLSKCE
jgi:hypothetical protein